jgi:hypothetical protein
MRVLPVSAFVAALIASSPALLAYADKAHRLDDLWHVLRSFGARAGIATLVALTLVHFGTWSRRILLPVFAVIYTGIDLSVGLRLGPLFSPRDDAAGQVPLYRDLAHWRDVNTPLSRTLRFLDERGVTGTAAAWRMEALGGPLGSQTPLSFRVNNASGYNPLRLNGYFEKFGGADPGTNLQTAPKLFSSAAPTYAAELYQRLGLRFVLLDRWVLENKERAGSIGLATDRVRAELTAAPWSKQLNVSGAYEVWELAGARERVELLGQENEPGGDCRIIHYGNTKVIIHCIAMADATLVLNDALAPGWFACVDAKRVPISPFLGFFRSVKVQKGDFVVTMRYQPLPWFRGFADCAGTNGHNE